MGLSLLLHTVLGADLVCVPGLAERGVQSADYVTRGTFDSIGNVRVYISAPHDAALKKGTMIYLPDGFGHAKHNFRLADRFAEVGWHVIIPDYYEGDAIPEQLLKRNFAVALEDEPWTQAEKDLVASIDFETWVKRHSVDRTEKLVHTVVSSLERGKEKVAAVGYCFGGKYAIRLAGTSFVDVVASFHPSFLEADDVKEGITSLYVGLAANDDMVPPTQKQDLTSWLTQAGALYGMETYDGVGHGFASRPDPVSPEGALQYQKAFEDTLKHLEASKSAL
ncbi:hypothetical protein N7457_008348 [Penicillium paradoxum]|uniref:uncharacterized protein n=1 Tax=Penicillium paradoxum TaxID=176176 RepID=UPI002546595E|nr:uncharacterized protein N7457_008348 [Penicillium paradoxum]KAJ5773452.1 hypothetical protein N7457_008348 [Penicillium paradoxum]